MNLLFKSLVLYGGTGLFTWWFIGKVSSSFSLPKETLNKLFEWGSLPRGERLYRQICELGNRQLLQDQEFSPFKGYEQISSTLISQSIEFGFGNRQGLESLKSWLRRELVLERRMRKVLVQGFWQMGFLTLLTWGYLHLLEQQLGMGLGSFASRVLCLTQLTGVLLLIPLFKWIEKASIGTDRELGKSLAIFGSLSQSGLDVDSVLSRTDLISSCQSAQVIDGERYYLLKRVQFLVGDWVSYGGGLRGEWSGIEEEFKELMQLKLEKFEEKARSSQFLLMALTFLIPYIIATVFLVAKSLEGSLIY